EKRRYGYYCLAILHHGRLVGRVDTKAQRDEGKLLARAVYLEPGVRPAKSLVNGLAGALAGLARLLQLRAGQGGRAGAEGMSRALGAGGIDWHAAGRAGQAHLTSPGVWCYTDISN